MKKAKRLMGVCLVALLFLIPCVFSFDLDLKDGEFVYNLIGEDWARDINENSEINEKLDLFYQKEGRLIILVLTDKEISETDVGELLKKLEEKAEKDEKVGDQTLLVSVKKRIHVYTNGNYNNEEFIPSVNKKIRSMEGFNEIVEEHESNKGPGTYLKVYSLWIEAFKQTLPPLPLVRKLRYVGGDKFSSGELTKERIEFVKAIQKDNIGAHKEELTRLFVHTEYDIYAYNERYAYYSSFEKFEKTWDNKLASIKSNYDAGEQGGKENFYLLKETIYDVLGISSNKNPYQKDKASIIYAFDSEEPLVQCGSGTRLFVAVAREVLTGGELDNLVVIATPGHLLPGYLDSNGDLYGMDMVVLGPGEVAFGNIKKEGGIGIEMIVYDAEKFVLAESLYSDYNVGEIHEQAIIFNNLEKPATEPRKPVDKGNFFNRVGKKIGVVKESDSPVNSDPSQGASSTFKRHSIFGFGTANVPSERLTMPTAVKVDPKIYSYPDVAQRISRGEGVSVEALSGGEGSMPEDATYVYTDSSSKEGTSSEINYEMIKNYKLVDVSSVQQTTEDGIPTILIPDREGKPSAEFYRFYIESRDQDGNGRADTIIVHYGTNKLQRSDGGAILTKKDMYQNKRYVGSGINWFLAEETGKDVPFDIDQVWEEWDIE